MPQWRQITRAKPRHATVMRAATVRINAVSGVAGFIKANDTVDVLITRQPIGPDGASQGKQVTDVLLQNIRVIAMAKERRMRIISSFGSSTFS